MSWIMHSLWIHLCLFALTMTCNVHGGAFQSHIRNYSWHAVESTGSIEMCLLYVNLRCVVQSSWRCWRHFSGRPPVALPSKNNLLLWRNSRSKHWPQDDETWLSRWFESTKNACWWVTMQGLRGSCPSKGLICHHFRPKRYLLLHLLKGLFVFSRKPCHRIHQPGNHQRSEFSGWLDDWMMRSPRQTSSTEFHGVSWKIRQQQKGAHWASKNLNVISYHMITT